MLLLNTRGYKHPVIPRSTGHSFFGTDNSKTEGALFHPHYTKENMEHPLCVYSYSHPTLCTQRWHLQHTTSIPAPARILPGPSLHVVHCCWCGFRKFLSSSLLGNHPAPHPSICTTSLHRRLLQWPLLSRGVSRAHTQPHHRYHQQFTASGISFLLPLGTALYPHSQGRNSSRM